MRVSLQAFGLADMITDLMDLKEGADGVMSDSLEQLAFEILSAAKDQAPVMTGNLMSSGEVEPDGGGYIVRFGADYAWPVHESTDEVMRGEPRSGDRKGHYWDGGKSKFLEDPYLQWTTGGRANAIITDRILDALLP